MSNTDLLDYIKQALKAGLSREAIKTNLLASGWQEQDIEMAFQSVAEPSAPPKKRRWKKVVLISVGVLVFLGAVAYFLPVILGFFFRDIAPIDDSDLKLQRVYVPDSENAYFDLVELGGTALEPKQIIYEPEGKGQMIVDMAAGKVWDDQLAEELIARNADAFEHFSVAARKPKFQDPAYVDPAKITVNTILVSFNSWRRMARLSAIRAQYLARQGNDKEALDEALKPIRIGQKIEESQGSMVGYLVAMAMKSIGLTVMQQIVSTSKLGAMELSRYAQELDQFYKNEQGLAAVFKGEYLTGVHVIDSITAEGVYRYLEESRRTAGNSGLPFDEKDETGQKLSRLSGSNYYWHPNRTKALIAEDARERIRRTTQPCDEVREIEISKLTPSSRMRLYVTENAIGKILHDLVAVGFTTVIQRKCEEDLFVAATQALLAIKAFKNDTGNYPVSLGELVPKYLSAVPPDPFDGKLLKYAVDRKAVYSVGKDGEDSGGSAGGDWRQMADPTFSVQF